MKLKTILASSLLATSFTTTSVLALPTLGDIFDPSPFDSPFHDAIAADDAQAFQLTDRSGISGDATAFLFMEFAGYHSTNTFGLYDYTIAPDGTVTVTDTLQVFNGADGGMGNTFDSTVISFDFGTGIATNLWTTATAMIDDTFGFYLGVPNESATWYTHTVLNSDAVDHVYSYDVRGTLSEVVLLGSDVVLAWEDLTGGGDKDYRDFVVGISDVRPVPAPATIALFGLGILVFAARRKV